MGFYSKTLHGEFNEHHNTLNGYMLSGDANSAATAAAITALNGRGDNDISPYSLNGYHLAESKARYRCFLYLQGYHL